MRRRAGEVRARLRGRVGQGHEPRPIRSRVSRGAASSARGLIIALVIHGGRPCAGRPLLGPRRVVYPLPMSHDFWERAAQIDPLWAILSDPTRHGRRWDLPSFFETGRREISLLLYQLRQLGHSPRPCRALDFGCGVGRLTQALGATFADVIGVDVSPTMIRLANQLNRSPGTVRYVLNQSPGLDQFESGLFDFVYSDIVLQHLEPEAAQGVCP